MKHKSIVYASSLFVLIAAFQNCNHVAFTQAVGSLSCADVLNTTTQNLKIVFMVDNSGSTGGTDPQHYYRAQTINTFISTYGSKPNFKYSFGWFAGSSQLYDVPTAKFVSPNAANAFGASSDLSNALNLFVQISPNGTTNYQQGFNAIQSAILNDSNSASWVYAVIFMSDGLPKDIPDPIDSGIISMVQSFLGSIHSAGRQATVSSVYFGPSDPAASGHLQTMAQAGGGQFVDTNNSNGQLNIGDIVTIPGTPCVQ